MSTFQQSRFGVTGDGPLRGRVGYPDGAPNRFFAGRLGTDDLVQAFLCVGQDWNTDKVNDSWIRWPTGKPDVLQVDRLSTIFRVFDIYSPRWAVQKDRSDR